MEGHFDNSIPTTPAGLSVMTDPADGESSIRTPTDASLAVVQFTQQGRLKSLSEIFNFQVRNVHEMWGYLTPQQRHQYKDSLSVYRKQRENLERAEQRQEDQDLRLARQLSRINKKSAKRITNDIKKKRKTRQMYENRIREFEKHVLQLSNEDADEPRT